MRRTRIIKRALASSLSIVVLIFFLFPIAWMVLTSFKSTVDADSSPFPISFRPILGNYAEVLFGGLVGSVPLFAHATLDSAVIAIGSALIALVLALPAAYTLARHKTRWNGRLGTWILSQKMAPAIFFLFPFYVMFYDLSLLDNFLSVILAHAALNLPLAVWMLKSLTEDIPPELDEQAKVDGCSDFGAFVRVVLPLLKSAISAAIILLFLLSWSELPFALILTGARTETFPVYLSQFAPYHTVSWNLVATSTIIGILPAIVLVFLVSKYLVRGLTLGAVKQ